MSKGKYSDREVQILIANAEVWWYLIEKERPAWFYKIQELQFDAEY